MSTDPTIDTPTINEAHDAGDHPETHIIDALKRQTEHRLCHTMADIIAQPTPGKEHLADAEIAQMRHDLPAWESHPLIRTYLRDMPHTAQHDTISGIQELSARVLEARRPSAIGRMCVNLMETTRPSVQFRSESKGKAATTNRGGITVTSYAARNSWITVKCDQEIEASDTWDLNFLEDAEWNVNMSNAMAIAKDVMELETTMILNKLDEIDGGDEGAGEQALNTTQDLTADHLITGWGQLMKQDANPDLCIMHPTRIAQLLKDDDFKDSTLLGEFANYRNGMFGNFLGMQILVSSLQKEQNVMLLDSSRVLFMALRRDRLMLPLNANHKYGLQISSRFGFNFGDKKSFAQIGQTS